MTTEQILEATVSAFNRRRFARAADLAEQGCASAGGRDEIFWLGLREMCRGYALIMDGRLSAAETHLVGAVERLRGFGFHYQNFDVPAALAGLRCALEESRDVAGRRKRSFDVTLLPTLRLAAKADL